MQHSDNNNAITYNDGEIEINVSIDSETVWLSRQQLSELFDRDTKTIGKHINNVFREKELEKNSTVANFATVQNEGDWGNKLVYNIENKIERSKYAYSKTKYTRQCI